MKALALDTETTFSNKGSPYDKNNFLVCYSWSEGKRACAARPSDDQFHDFTREVAECNRLVLFNCKFDLAWCLKTGIDFSGKDIWDVQLGEFILSRQQDVFPSLEATAVKYDLGHKIDVIKNEYWNKGINTDQIPWTILKEYAAQDALLTYQAYLKQVEQFQRRPLMYKLFKLQCRDALILMEMERNGLIFDSKMTEIKKKELEEQLQQLTAKLNAIYPDVPVNFGSNDQLSCFLFGGTIVLTDRVMEGYFKTGKKAGEPKYRKVDREVQLPRIFEPIRGSERAKEGYWGTSVPILNSLKVTKKNKWIIESLLEVSRIEKLISTYYEGLPKINRTMNWNEGELHGQYNQVRVATGRLSSSSPNLQNLSGDSLEVFISRFN